MFQFLNDWKRQKAANNKHSNNTHAAELEQDEVQDYIIRTDSMASDNSSTPSSTATRDSAPAMSTTPTSTIDSPHWLIDWNQSKRPLSFKEDYVSFPSLEAPTNNEVSCSN
ncbi:hypothetical protein BDF20DRAFT_649350 [Mycotypha africana]|uniref:uncharacterized protein n=1 Tax=Mycotypha africana TaxID=64632 RepID=UPI0023005D24|nr:uncharacterized protein BDF20DRAFT_649350 [Mycotypha africana]KAI8973397.1 hypothetical protein BDF20DRAFT_649350 [Mycotypha africana]